MIGERLNVPGPSDVVALEVRHYGHQPGVSRLYDDDGETVDYERGDRTWTRLVATRYGSGAWTGQVTPDVNGKAWRYSQVSWTFMTPTR